MVKSRHAFTFIELIFAIVVIAIAVVSLPAINTVISKGVENNLVQEAIFAAATKLNEAVTAYWDENSFEAGTSDSLSRVIDTGDCENNASLSNFRQRPGHIDQVYHRRCLESSATLIAHSATNANILALNDMQGAASIFINMPTGDLQAGYKKNYTATVAVDANATFNGAANINMKRISVTITDGANIITSLATYSANIGEIDYYKRNY